MKPLDITAYPVRMFAWLRDEAKLVSESSTLGFPVGKVPHQRLYADACDTGIRVKGDTTDHYFLFVEEEVNAYDQELLAWHFKPLDSACPIKELIIFND